MIGLNKRVRLLLVSIVLVTGIFLFAPWRPAVQALRPYAGLNSPNAVPKVESSNADAVKVESPEEAGSPEADSKESPKEDGTKEGSHDSPDASIDLAKLRKDHYSTVFKIIDEAWPNVTLGKYKHGKGAPKKGGDMQAPVLSTEILGNYLDVSSEEVDRLTKGHKIAVDKLPAEYPSGLYKGRGIVTVAGGKYVPLLLTSLRMLRKVTPELPVEVFMADDNEYEKDLCEKIMPQLNAKCIKLADVIGEDPWKKYEIRSYQLKVLSILASSFEDVLFLDSDSIPLHDVEQFFSKEPYTSKGYIFWPDYWLRTTSPHFYEVAGRELGERVRGDLSITDPKLVPQADRKGALADKSCEAGQMYVSKAQHYKSLLLATYYNLNGFDAYYKLISQGAAGEGDKDTFIAAAEMLGEPYHQIHQPTRSAGFWDNNGEWHGTGMLQADPLDDYEANVLNKKDAEIKIQFMHLNFPKPNPRELMGSHKEQYENDEKRLRYYGSPSENAYLLGEQDVELHMWRHLEWTACEVGVTQGIVVSDWKENNITEMCQKIKDQVAWLAKTSDVQQS
ncbi:alpha-1,2-mannosyltransferase Mnn2p [Trichomonascus vanleenenianus]|uniref:alpha-mannosyltransferase n=1 Tax=Trichomonascus vanleenenianus TaxID=2268995 RepID=UPI003ECA8C8F